MRDDPIITEVREVRHRISEENGHDLRKLAKHYQEVERELAKTGRYQFVTGFFSTDTQPEPSKAKPE